ncbi:MAG TPA: hypothetical protein PK385_12465 [Spirochaetota bacterium]|nr:hypothetical protein [Spirochaetota bacterium]HOS33972.1 hypothetical protein [Spirochaetota bacterium]HOS56858.1 hypothetical protein [Spirochaetota bacterium]HQF78884.1 hypothetical protein [Spirochaetota bacterium]HQH31357.1 hypothetical protein [Spirochaetota bacterium]
MDIFKRLFNKKIDIIYSKEVFQKSYRFVIRQKNISDYKEDVYYKILNKNLLKTGNNQKKIYSWFKYTIVAETDFDTRMKYIENNRIIGNVILYYFTTNSFENLIFDNSQLNISKFEKIIEMSLDKEIFVFYNNEPYKMLWNSLIYEKLNNFWRFFFRGINDKILQIDLYNNNPIEQVKIYEGISLYENDISEIW